MAEICGCDDNYYGSCAADALCGCDDTGEDSVIDTSLNDDYTPDLQITPIIPRFSKVQSAEISSALNDYNTAISALNTLGRNAISKGLKYSDNVMIMWYRTQILSNLVSEDYLKSTISYLANREFQDILNNYSIKGGSVNCPSDCGGYCGSYNSCHHGCSRDCSDCSDCGDSCGCDDCSTDYPGCAGDDWWDVCDVCGGDCGSGDDCDYCSSDGGWL